MLGSDSGGRWGGRGGDATREDGEEEEDGKKIKENGRMKVKELKRKVKLSYVPFLLVYNSYTITLMERALHTSNTSLIFRILSLILLNRNTFCNLEI